MRKIQGNKSVLVLEVHAKASVPVLESCAAMGLHVVGGSWKKYCCGFYSRATAERLRYPCPDREPEQCITSIRDFLKQRSIDVLFPVGDVMTDLIARHQDELRRCTGLVLPPYPTFVQGRSKILTLKAAERAGCPIPATWYPHEQTLADMVTDLTYPVLIKPDIAAGARGITVCNSAAEVLSRFEQTESHFGRCFIQEYVPQTGMQYKVDAVVDEQQQLLAGVVYAKLRYYPPTGGSSVLNRTEHRPDILESACRVLRELRWAGFCDFDFITDPRDNTVKLMEINPRYPESFRATVAAGVDMTRIIYQLARGETPEPQLDYREGRYLRFLFGDIMWFLTTRENRWAARPSFFDFFRSDTLYQLERARDWGIVIGYLLENLSILWDKKARRFRLRRDHA